jgi:hypothetical protein
VVRRLFEAERLPEEHHRAVGGSGFIKPRRWPLVRSPGTRPN